MADEYDGDKKRERIRNWTVDEYGTILHAANNTLETLANRRLSEADHQRVLFEEFERLSVERGGDFIKRDNKVVMRTLESMRTLHKFVRDKPAHTLDLAAPIAFIHRKGTKKLWECFRNPQFRALCDALFSKLELALTSVIPTTIYQSPNESSLHALAVASSVATSQQQRSKKDTQEDIQELYPEYFASGATAQKAGVKPTKRKPDGTEAPDAKKPPTVAVNTLSCPRLLLCG
eukprot:m.659898 g.659898  ORF g.659898 m.659898 type:complete len:233 (-) comp58445_c0_seq3:31-729(-)